MKQEPAPRGVGIQVLQGLEDVNGDFSQWKGDVYRLVTLVAEKQKESDREKLVNAGFPEAAEVI